MIYEKYIFHVEDSNTYFKRQMNGLRDPSLQDFQFLSYSPLLKKECQHEKAKKEYVNSYMAAAKILAQESRGYNSDGLFIIKSYSLALPCIFLCRQALELSIKGAITQLDGKYNAIHSLLALWDKFIDCFCEKATSSKDERLLSDMRMFIGLISEFDNDNATKLRYSEDKSGKLSQSEAIFVNLEKITETTELFIKQMESITGINSI